MKIEDIPTEQFQRIIKTLVQNGWELAYSYDGFDVWIDYAEVHLTKDKTLIKFTWDNWMEGEIEADCEVEEVCALL